MSESLYETRGWYLLFVLRGERNASASFTDVLCQEWAATCAMSKGLVYVLKRDEKIISQFLSD